jgi:hypothetical protein
MDMMDLETQPDETPHGESKEPQPDETPHGESKEQDATMLFGHDEGLVNTKLEMQVSTAKAHRLFPEFEKTELMKVKEELGDEYVEFGDPHGDPEADLESFWCWVSSRDDGKDNNGAGEDENETETKANARTIFTPSHTYPAPPSDKHPDINRILESAAEADSWGTKWNNITTPQRFRLRQIQS